MKFSVIIPTYNRCEQLQATLKSVSNQSIKDFELIVVNDGSTDGTASFLNSTKIENLIVLHQKNSGPASARNAGIKISKGDFIAFTDDDCVVPENWLSNFEKVFHQSSADVIAGFVQNASKSVFSAISQYIINYSVAYLYQKHTNTSFFTSNNIAYRREVIQSVGGFDERFKQAGGEERLLNFKLILNGKKIIFSPEIIVKHFHKLDFLSFVQQFFNYGKGSYLIYKICKDELKQKPPFVPIVTYTSFLKELFKQNIMLGLSVLFFLIISQVSAFVGFVNGFFKFRK